MDKGKPLQRGKTPKKPPRKNLYKQGSDHVEVFCRIRPLDNASEPISVQKLNQTTVLLAPPETYSATRNGPVLKETHHTFQCVFDDQTHQRALFEHVALPLVDDVLHGKNALLFAYGVTSSGKTHTMTGTAQDFGVLPRCLDSIFVSIGDMQARKYVFKPDKMNGFDIQSEADAMLERQGREVNPRLAGAGPSSAKIPRSSSREGGLDGILGSGLRADVAKIEDLEADNCYAVFVSYVEIYNNYVYDLLDELPTDPIGGPKAPASKLIREDGDHNMYVSGAVEVEVKTTEEAYELLLKGKRRRKVGYTTLNSESSRSHSVFCVRLVQAPLDPSGAEVLQDKRRICVSQLCLVDLAGSERSGRTGSAGDRLKEAGNINQSLMALRSCIEALRDNQNTGANKMVPYRDSRLTHLFKNFFDGEGKVRMIVCVNPKACEYDETVQVMKFAELTQEVQIARPQEVRFDLGLTPGRRAVNQTYKLARARQEAGRGNTEGTEMVVPRVAYNLGLPFSSLEAYSANSDAYSAMLVKFLSDRDASRSTLLLDMASKEEAFRTRLLDADRELVELRAAGAQNGALLRTRDAELNEANRRCAAFERTLEAQLRKISAYELERINLEREVGEKSWKIVQEKLERDRLQLDYNARLEMNEQKHNLNIEATKRRIKEESAAQLRSKQNKLDAVRLILNTESDSGGSTGNTPSEYPPQPRGGPPKSTPAAPLRSILVQARSDPDLLGGGGSEERGGTHLGGSGGGVRYGYQRGGGAVVPPTPRVFRAKSPPAVKSKPLVTRKNHRRSRSSESIWLEHKPEPTTGTKTLLQPRMKTIKSVVKLSERDVRDREVSKYVLNHQNLDSDGDMTTQLVKGDILTTQGGGASVVFTDVEVIKVRAPGDSRKRMSDADSYEGGERGEEEDWTDVETRCSIAIEGHAKRTKYSDV